MKDDDVIVRKEIHMRKSEASALMQLAHDDDRSLKNYMERIIISHLENAAAQNKFIPKLKKKK